jgi:hypothetical protein
VAVLDKLATILSTFVIPGSACGSPGMTDARKFDGANSVLHSSSAHQK